MIHNIEYIFSIDVKLIETKCGRKSRGVLELYRVFQKTPMMTIPKATELLKGRVSKPTLYSAAEELLNLGIIESLQVKENSTQLYSYKKFIQLMIN